MTPEEERDEALDKHAGALEAIDQYGENLRLVKQERDEARAKLQAAEGGRRWKSY